MPRREPFPTWGWGGRSTVGAPVSLSYRLTIVLAAGRALPTHARLGELHGLIACRVPERNGNGWDKNRAPNCSSPFDDIVFDRAGLGGDLVGGRAMSVHAGEPAGAT